MEQPHSSADPARNRIWDGAGLDHRDCPVRLYAGAAAQRGAGVNIGPLLQGFSI